MVDGARVHEGPLDSLAARLMKLDSPVYGDERERGVVLEATGFGWTVGHYLAGLFALGAVATGHVAMSVVLLVAACVPVFAAQWYASRRQVDFTALALRDPGAVRRSRTVALVFVALFCVALGFLGFAGRPLVPLPAVSDEAFRGGLQGAAVGGAIGALCGLAWQAVAARRGRRRPQLDADEPDDVF